MKKPTGIALCFALAMILPSCDLLNVNIDTVLNADLDIEVEEVNLKSMNVGNDFFASDTLDPMSDPDVQEYIDNIQDWTVNNIKVTVISVSVSDVVFSTGTYFKIYNDSNSAIWELEEDLPVIIGTQVLLDNSEGGFDEVRAILKNNSEFVVCTGGTCTRKGVKVLMRLSIDATVSANPL